MAMRLIQVQYLGSDDVSDWYSDLIPQIGETVRFDNHQYGKHYRVVNVIHRLWPELLRAESIPTIVLAEIASEVDSGAEDE